MKSNVETLTYNTRSHSIVPKNDQTMDEGVHATNLDDNVGQSIAPKLRKNGNWIDSMLKIAITIVEEGPL